MEEYKKYVCVKETNGEEYRILYVDFKDINSTEEGTIIGPNIFTKEGSLTQTDETKVKQLLVENIVKLSNQLPQEIINMFSMKNVSMDKIKYKIQNGSNYLASNGRIGPPRNMLVSEDNYFKYNLKDICDTINLTVLFDNSVNDIYLYRINSIDQPGLSLLYFEDKYEFISTGFFPHYQFMKIEL